jgi:Flp pilus assembly protein TadD
MYSFFNNLALCYDYLGQYDKAREGYEKAIALSPCDPKSHANLGKLYDQQGRKEDALREYEKAKRCDPEVKIP